MQRLTLCVSLTMGELRRQTFSAMGLTIEPFQIIYESLRNHLLRWPIDALRAGLDVHINC